METFGATKKRSVEDEGESSGGNEKRKRRSGSNAVDFLREKASSEMKTREEGLALQKERQKQEVIREQQQQQQETQRQLQQQNIPLVILRVTTNIITRSYRYICQK